MKFSDAVQTLLIDVRARRLSPRTAEFYEVQLMRVAKLLNDKDVRKITTTDLRLVLTECPTNSAPHRYRSLSRLFSFLVDEEVVSVSPTALPGRDVPMPVVKTLHAQANDMLRHNLGAAPGRKFRFLLEHEESAMLYDIAPAVPDNSFGGGRGRCKRV
jgi:site-specific recombinase XerD